MSTTLAFKEGIDRPQWRADAFPVAASAAGQAMAYDLRGGPARHPLLYLLRTATNLDAYNPALDEWMALASPALTGTFGAGATAIFHPSQGPRGTLAAGWSTTTGALTTALPASVAVNQLANRGDGLMGFRIRIFQKASASPSRTNERTIIGNTSGTTPTIILDKALDFTPASGDGYEILSGRVFMLSAAALAAGMWKYYDIATNSFSGNLATTNLPATVATDSVALALSEAHVSSDRNPGDGFVSGGATYDTAPSSGFPTNLNCIQATAADATHITGSGMPTDLQANEYVNFQIRIVEDTTTLNSVGQRAKITANGSGASAQFTVGSWPSATPSASAKFVVENNDDQIIVRSSTVNTFFTYSISGDTWSASTFTAGGSAVGAGLMMEQAFGIPRSQLTLVNNTRRHSHIFCFRGAAATTLDLLDIANGANGTVTAALGYGNLSTTFTTGVSAAYDPWTLNGRYLHINNAGQRMLRFDMLNQVLEMGSLLRFTQGAAIVGQKMASRLFIDGSTKLSWLHMLGHTLQNMFSTAVQF